MPSHELERNQRMGEGNGLASGSAPAGAGQDVRLTEPPGLEVGFRFEEARRLEKVIERTSGVAAEDGVQVDFHKRSVAETIGCVKGWVG